uniref:Uncharacterized protein n=1 Tax=Triticum urartu TaxID=4572 RepID=A0A8R7QNU0_TRIUA
LDPLGSDDAELQFLALDLHQEPVVLQPHPVILQPHVLQLHLLPQIRLGPLHALPLQLQHRVFDLDLPLLNLQLPLLAVERERSVRMLLRRRAANAGGGGGKRVVEVAVVVMGHLIDVDGEMPAPLPLVIAVAAVVLSVGYYLCLAGALVRLMRRRPLAPAAGPLLVVVAQHRALDANARD